MGITEIFINIILSVLIILLIVTIIKYPKDAFVKFPFGLLKNIIGWDLIEDFFSKNDTDVNGDKKNTL